MTHKEIAEHQGWWLMEARLSPLQHHLSSLHERKWTHVWHLGVTSLCSFLLLEVRSLAPSSYLLLIVRCVVCSCFLLLVGIIYSNKFKPLGPIGLSSSPTSIPPMSMLVRRSSGNESKRWAKTKDAFATKLVTANASNYIIILGESLCRTFHQFVHLQLEWTETRSNSAILHTSTKQHVYLSVCLVYLYPLKRCKMTVCDLLCAWRRM